MSQNDIFVASVAHHIGAYNVVTSLFLCSSWFEVRSLDHRSYRTWTTKLGLIHVAAMYFKANAAADEKSFWGALARSVELKELETMQSKRRTMINVEVTVASTQHIHHFPLVKNSASQESYLLHQTKVFQSNSICWDVDFLAGVAHPFSLEIVARQEATGIAYFYTVDPKYLTDVIKYCFANLLEKRIATAADNVPLFKLLTDNLVFNDQEKCIFLTCAEKAKIIEFATVSIDSDKQKLIEDTIDELALGKAMRKSIQASIVPEPTAAKTSATAGPSQAGEEDNAEIEDAAAAATAQLLHQLLHPVSDEAAAAEAQAAQAAFVQAQVEADRKLKADVLGHKFYFEHGPQQSSIDSGKGLPYSPLRGMRKRNEAVGYRNVLAEATKQQQQRERDKVDEIPSFMYLSDILNSTVGIPRSRASKNVIITALKEETELGGYMAESSGVDLAALAQDCYLKSCIRKTEQVATEGANISGLLVIIKGNMRLHINGEIVVKKAGDLLGDELLRGHRTWEQSISVWKHEVVHFCVIPADAVLKYVGVARADTSIFMHCFWKYARLWSLFADPRAPSQQLRDSLQSISNSVNITSSRKVTMMTAADLLQPQHPNSGGVGVNGSGGGDNNKDDESDDSDSDDDEITTESLVSGLRPTLALAPQSLEPRMSAATRKQTNSRKVIEPCRIHHFQAGDDVFRKGQPRHFMYVVVRGECALVRSVSTGLKDDKNNSSSSRPNSPAALSSKLRNEGVKPGSPATTSARSRPASPSNTSAKVSGKDSVFGTAGGDFEFGFNNNMGATGETLGQIELDVGQHLLPGDFCFMDGEPDNWFDSHDDAISRKLAQTLNTPILFRRNHLFGEHKNTLLALTKTELCVLPLHHVYESGAVFIALLKLMNTSYPNLKFSDADLLKARTESLVFEGNRPKLVARLLNESIGRVPTSQAMMTFASTRKEKALASYTKLMEEHSKKISVAKHALGHLTRPGSKADAKRPATAATVTPTPVPPMRPPSTSSQASKFRLDRVNG